VWSIDRRTTRRYFLFTPDDAGVVKNLFWYCLAVCAEKHGVIVHAAMLMSTHLHLVYTDARGVQPDFKRDLHRLFALGIKAMRGWPEEVFKAGQGGEHEPLNEAALVEDIAYAIANPSAALAVRYAKDWPGAKTAPRDIGRRVIVATRPSHFFDSDNPQWPEVATLHIQMPAALELAYGIEAAQRLISAEVKRLESQALERSKRSGVPFKGARRVMQTPHTTRACKHELFGKVNPRFRAAGDRDQARKKVAEMHQFDCDYGHALERWTAGDRHAIFPHGTWAMRVQHGVRCHPPP
jgi:hypothetical protein